MAITGRPCAHDLREVNLRIGFVPDTCVLNELIEDVRDMENSPNAAQTIKSGSVEDASNTISRFSFLYSNPADPARMYRVSLAYDGRARTPRCRIEIRDANASTFEEPFSAGPLTRDSLSAAVAMLPLIEDATGGDRWLGTGSACLFSGSFLPAASRVAMY
jgi:hypothetical protein